MFTKEVKIAIVAIVGIVILYLGLNFLKGASLFSNNEVYYIRFSDINGLSSSNPIYADGYQVGVVKKISYDYSGSGNILVEFEVNKNLRIPKGSSGEISSDFMGNVKMNLLLANNPHERVQPGDTINGVVNEGMMGKVSDAVPAMEKMLPKLDSILTNLNALLANPALAQSLSNVQSLSANLVQTSAQLNVLMVQMNKDIPGLLGKTNQALNTTNSVLNNTNRFTANLAQIDVEGTMRQVNQTISNVNALTVKLNSPEGTVGKLLNDPTLYDRLSSTASHADSLLIDLKAHPKRYVHFSIFGRKDK